MKINISSLLITWALLADAAIAVDATAEGMYQRAVNLQSWTYASELISEKKTLSKSDVIKNIVASAFEYWYLTKYGKLERIRGVEFKIKKIVFDNGLINDDCYQDPLSWLDNTPEKRSISGLRSEDVEKYKSLISEFHEFVAKLAQDERLKE